MAGLPGAADAPAGEAALLGTGPVPDGDGAALRLVQRVELARPATATAVAGALERVYAGEVCSTSEPFADLVDDVDATVDGSVVTVTAVITDTVTGDGTKASLPNGSLWLDLWERLDLPYVD